jgi:hypothetical protein
MAFLQRVVEVDELFGPGARGMRLGKEVLLGSLDLEALGIMLYAHPPRGAFKKPPIHPPTRQWCLPYYSPPSFGQGAILATRQLAVARPLRLKEKKPFTNQQVQISAMTRSKPKQSPEQSKTPPG